MNINSKTIRNNNSKEGKMKITGNTLTRLGGLAAMAAGILFIAIQPIHPLDILSSVTTAQWAIVHYLAVAMGIFAVLGISAIYARQVEKAGWLGLVGYLLYVVFWSITTAFQFAEAFITPVVGNAAPKVAEAWLGMVTNAPSEVSLGALPNVYLVNGLFYVAGGLVFGIATFRAGVLPRWAGALLAVLSVLPIVLSSVVPHPYDRIFAVPVGLSLAWMGYALLAERREGASEQAAAKSVSTANSEVTKPA